MKFQIGNIITNSKEPLQATAVIVKIEKGNYYYEILTSINKHDIGSTNDDGIDVIDENCRLIYKLEKALC